jgi:tetratricopeptide (TPR) repeat protein
VLALPVFVAEHLERFSTCPSQVPSLRCASRPTSFKIPTSKTPLTETLYNLHLEGWPPSTANKEVTTLLKSTLTKNGVVTPRESAVSIKREGGGALWLTRRYFTILAILLLHFLPFIPSGKAQDPGTARLPSVPVKPAARNPAPSPDQLEAPLVEAKSLMEKGLLRDAERAVRHHLETHPDSADGHFLLGYILFREIQAGAGVETTAGGVKNFDVDPADGKAREEKAKDSLAEFTAGARYHDPSAFDLKIVALDYVLLGDYVDADKWLTRSLAWNPQDSDSWYYLGRARYNENKFAAALDAFLQCLKLSPGNVKAEDNLGLAYAGLGRNEEATAAYQQAMAWQSQATLRNPGPYIDLGSLLLDENRPEEAVPYLLQAVQIAPRESRGHELLGKAYTRLDKLREAQTELEKAVELSPLSANLHCMLAPVYRKQSMAEKAKAEFDRCAALNGSHSIPETPRP